MAVAATLADPHALPGHFGGTSEYVWLRDPDAAWVPARIVTHGDGFMELESDKGVVRVAGEEMDDLAPCGVMMNEDLENLVDLDVLSEGSILHHVRKRYHHDFIYTHVGNILVAVNPFRPLPIYSDRAIEDYKSGVASGSDSLPPHVFDIAALAYDQLCKNESDQSVLISGESGAGKTETTKKVLQYIARVAGGRSAGEVSVEDQILQSNPVLEAFGNAKTLRNNNSSRFGKWMEIMMDTSFRIQGCHLVSYLLEKSRVVIQTPMERNYHIFYQMLAGAPSSLKREFRLEEPDFYHYLNQSGCVAIDGTDDAAEFSTVLTAFDTLQFTDDERNTVFRILAAILHMGNLMFEPDEGEDTSRIDGLSFDALDAISTLLIVDKDMLARSLTEKLVQAGRGSFVAMDLRPDQARDTRDVLAKNLYAKMFGWLIRRINDNLGAEDDMPFRIGVLDIFGFEVFGVNSFEQLCINYANEKLQFHFNEVIFSMELALYEEEGISYEHIDFQDNSQCVFLIEGRPLGILALLEEECSLKGNVSDLSFASKLQQNFGERNAKMYNYYYHRKRNDPPENFSVRHFAGPVKYDVTGFIEKNRDVISETLAQMAAQSGVALVAELFKEEVAKQRPARGRGGKKQQSRKTLGGQFTSQLADLMTTLGKTEPHFIRCIKPNENKAPNDFNPVLSLRQLKYAGLFEAIRIRKSGYAYRIPFALFSRRYCLLVSGLLTQLDRKAVEARDACEMILTSIDSSSWSDHGWAIGRTRVFLKGNIERTFLERERAARSERFVIALQAMFRMYVARKAYRRHLNKNREEELEAQREQSRIDFAATALQALYRGHQARVAFQRFADLIDLRRAVDHRDIREIEEVLERFNYTRAHVGIFKQEITRAEKMARMLRSQDKLLRDISEAMEAVEPAELNRLLARADRMEMTNHPEIESARAELGRLQEKRTVMTSLLEFLKKDTRHAERIPQLLEDASRLGVDTTFVDEVEEVYHRAAPKIEATGRLRRAVENVHYNELVASLEEIKSLQSQFGDFAQQEVRAGQQLLQMLKYEAQLYYGARPGEEADTARRQERGIRMNSEVKHLCDVISRTRWAREKQSLKRRLARWCGSPDRYDMVIRSYKWSRLYAVWRYPEFNDGNFGVLGSPQKGRGVGGTGAGTGGGSSTGGRRGGGGKMDDDSDDSASDGDDHVVDDQNDLFFGYRPARARESLHVVVTLHGGMQGAKPPEHIKKALETSRFAEVMNSRSKAGREIFAQNSASNEEPDRNHPPPRKSYHIGIKRGTLQRFKEHGPPKPREPPEDATPEQYARYEEALARWQEKYAEWEYKHSVEQRLAQSRNAVQAQQTNLKTTNARLGVARQRRWK